MATVGGRRAERMAMINFEMSAQCALRASCNNIRECTWIVAASGLMTADGVRSLVSGQSLHIDIFLDGRRGGGIPSSLI